MARPAGRVNGAPVDAGARYRVPESSVYLLSINPRDAKEYPNAVQPERDRLLGPARAKSQAVSRFRVNRTK